MFIIYHLTYIIHIFASGFAGCGGMHQYIMHTEVHNVFGFADPKHRESTLVDLASHTGRNPPLIALKSDDVLAFSSWDDACTSYQTCVGIVSKKQDRGRGGKRKAMNRNWTDGYGTLRLRVLQLSFCQFRRYSLSSPF